MKAQSPEQLYKALLKRAREADKTVVAVRAENHRLRQQIDELEAALNAATSSRRSREDIAT